MTPDETVALLDELENTIKSLKRAQRVLTRYDTENQILIEQNAALHHRIQELEGEQ